MSSDSNYGDVSDNYGNRDDGDSDCIMLMVVIFHYSYSIDYGSMHGYAIWMYWWSW